MPQVTNDFTNYRVDITEEYNLLAAEGDIDSTPYLDTIDQELIISIVDLELVEKFTNFSYEVNGITNTRLLETYYRLSRNGNSSWTEWFKLEEEITNFPPFDPLDEMSIDIKFIRTGSKVDGRLRILSFSISGDLYRGEDDGTSIIRSNSTVVIKPPFTYKVFRIDDVEILSPHSLDDIEIKYRYSQDNTRTWSAWEPLTKENISTTRINPIRFFHIEYFVSNTGSTAVKITDINLIGDFQNVTEDYKKTNLFGIRDCCQSYIVRDQNGNIIGGVDSNLSGDSCDPNTLPQLSEEDKANLWNPYQQTEAFNLLNKLSSDATAMFGHRIRYFSTDPDGKGIDYSLNEFQLYNIVCEGYLKATVENNQFPDNQITMNAFDLTLFDSFEIQITKIDFKKIFGAQRRPSKEDIIWFCDINRLFIVDHAQQFRSFNNAAIYYKVILKKYNKASNVIPGSKTIEDSIKELTKNTTIDELFGIEIKADKDSIANKKQQQTLTRDPIRLEYKAEIIRELVENSSTVISKQHYDFSNLLVDGFVTMTQSVPGVIYKNIINNLKASDNIGYFVWFKIGNYINDENYNFYNCYDTVNELGWRVNLINDVITLDLNSDSYVFNLDDSLSEDVWYCYVLNVDQRQRKINQWIYKRDVDDDEEDRAKFLNKTVLRNIYSDELDMVPVEFELEGIDGSILSSDMKVTNIRLFSEIIPQTEHNLILNQYLVGDDAKYLIFADNANTRIILPNFPYGTKENN
jgi:hypothetical protein